MSSPARKKAKEKALALKKAVGKPDKRIVGSTYITKKGDTLSDIADKMGLTVRQIRETNPKMFKKAKKMNEVPTGIKLKIPTVKSIGETQDFASRKSPKKVYDLSKKDMEAITLEKAHGGMTKKRIGHNDLRANKGMLVGSINMLKNKKKK